MPDADLRERCSFCNRTKREVKYLVQGTTARICIDCIDKASKALEATKTKELGEGTFKIPTPHEIRDFLDTYVIGQDDAKIALAVAVFDHYLRLIDAESALKDDVEIEKTNILMVGPTGCGKTHLVKTIARMLDVPFTIADATRLTEAGFVGDDVEDILSPLLKECGGDPSHVNRSIVFIDEIDKITSTDNTSTSVRDVRGKGVQQALLKLLEGSKVMVPMPGHRRMATNEQSVEIDTSNILFIVSGAFPRLEEIISRRVNKKVGIGLSSVGVSSTHIKDESDLFALTETEDLREYGFIPEFLGRIPVVVALRDLSTHQLIEVLTKPKNAIIRQYQRKFTIGCGVDLEFTVDALKTIAEKAKKMGRGARGLRGIIDPLLRTTMYDLPSEKSQWEKIIITTDVVKGTASPTKIPTKIQAVS